jgi:hypothetical protein
LVLLLAAGLIGAGSASSSVTGSVPPLPRSAIAIPLETVALLAVVAWAIVLALLVYRLWPRGPCRRRSEFELVPQRWHTPWSVQVVLLALSAAIVAGLIVALVLLRMHGISSGAAAPPSPTAAAARPTAGSPLAPMGAGSTWWLQLPIVGSLVLAAIVLLGYLSRPGVRFPTPWAGNAGPTAEAQRAAAIEMLHAIREDGAS